MDLSTLGAVQRVRIERRGLAVRDPAGSDTWAITREGESLQIHVRAQCIGCGACVAACKNASAMLFVSAKVSQLALLPQGQPERYQRVGQMVARMDEEGFGNCTNTAACSAACPKEISMDHMARMNRDFFLSIWHREE